MWVDIKLPATRYGYELNLQVNLVHSRWLGNWWKQLATLALDCFLSNEYDSKLKIKLINFKQTNIFKFGVNLTFKITMF